jgi:hypothetical protein
VAVEHPSDANGACVETADDLPGVIAVRDSKDPAGPALVFTAEEWWAFIAGEGWGVRSRLSDPQRLDRGARRG